MKRTLIIGVLGFFLGYFLTTCVLGDSPDPAPDGFVFSTLDGSVYIINKSELRQVKELSGLGSKDDVEVYLPEYGKLVLCSNYK